MLVFLCDELFVVHTCTCGKGLEATFWIFTILCVHFIILVYCLLLLFISLVHVVKVG